MSVPCTDLSSHAKEGAWTLTDVTASSKHLVSPFCPGLKPYMFWHVTGVSWWMRLSSVWNSQNVKSLQQYIISSAFISILVSRYDFISHELFSLKYTNMRLWSLICRSAQGRHGAKNIYGCAYNFLLILLLLTYLSSFPSSLIIFIFFPHFYLIYFCCLPYVCLNVIHTLSSILLFVTLSSLFSSKIFCPSFYLYVP
jgi:hypothetical protein